MVVLKELRRARHLRREPRQDHHEVLRAVERDRHDPGVPGHPHPGLGARAEGVMAESGTGTAIGPSLRPRGFANPRLKPKLAAHLFTLLFLALWQAASM